MSDRIKEPEVGETFFGQLVCGNYDNLYAIQKVVKKKQERLPSLYEKLPLDTTMCKQCDKNGTLLQVRDCFKRKY